MGSLGCCFVWLLVGALFAWLLNYWLRKRCSTKTKKSISKDTKSSIAKTANAPIASATPEKKPAAKTTSKKPKTTATKTTIDLAAAKAAGIRINNPEDLTVIEGVGPKINDLFKDNGLKSFEQVSAATVKEMRAILDKGGARYRMANPSTWAKQAKLAANNKWKELKKLQDKTSDGKKK